MIDRIEKGIKKTTSIFNAVAGFAIVVATALVVLNILLREIFGAPILGTYEFTGILTAIIVCCSIAYTLVLDAHISIDIVVEKIKPRGQAIIDTITNILVLVFMSVFSYNLFAYATKLLKSNSVSPTTQFPFYIIVYLAAICFVLLCLVILLRIKRFIEGAAGK